MATKSQKYRMTKYVVKIMCNGSKVSPGSFSISEGFLLSHNFCLLTEDVACVSAGPATLLLCSCVTSSWLEAVSTELTRADTCRGELEIRVTRRGQLALLPCHVHGLQGMPGLAETTQGTPPEQSSS